MSRCTCGNNEEFQEVPRTRMVQMTSVPEILQICVNAEKPTNMVPGTERLFVYWRISFQYDYSNQKAEIYVPPEWRSIHRERLEEWINQLRMYPYEPVSLGQTRYQWVTDILLPEGQDPSRVPIPGRYGWPHVDEPTLHFSAPRPQTASGRYLPIGINRRRTHIELGIEKIVCYWLITLPPVNNPDQVPRQVWVPPEWRKLKPTIFEKWKYILANCIGNDIQLGGTLYQWHTNTLIPLGQIPGAIERLGCGRYKGFRPDEPSEATDETNALRERVTQSQARVLPPRSAEHWILSTPDLPPPPDYGTPRTTAVVNPQKENPPAKDTGYLARYPLLLAALSQPTPQTPLPTFGALVEPSRKKLALTPPDPLQDIPEKPIEMTQDKAPQPNDNIPCDYSHCTCSLSPLPSNQTIPLTTRRHKKKREGRTKKPNKQDEQPTRRSVRHVTPDEKTEIETTATYLINQISHEDEQETNLLDVPCDLEDVKPFIPTDT